MKLTFKAGQIAPDAYEIDGEIINGFDLSPLDYDGVFLGDESTRALGIRQAWRDAEGELHVILTQRVIASRIPGLPTHWRGDTAEIDAASYDPQVCYVVPTGLLGLIEGVDYQITWAEGIMIGEAGFTCDRLEVGQ